MARQPGVYATFDTSEGTIVCRLFEEEAPITVKNFIELAEGSREWTHPQTKAKSKARLYDGTVFHRVIPDFMVQGGDPTGTGMGVGPATSSRTRPRARRTSSTSRGSWPWPTPAPAPTAHANSSSL